MTGKLKVLSSTNPKIIRKKTFDKARIHFRDHNKHTITIFGKKSVDVYVGVLMGATIEAESILWPDADVWTEEGVGGTATQVELRFYPS
tara:strand:+ start:720 stop:986 length:267 start_codon:yes stop_codon:yes gene_type:complete